MKLSVIVPVYRAETTLRKCVDSLLAQTLSDLEIILVNDGSPAGSQVVMDEYAARFPDKVRTRTVSNGGQGRARNIGIDMARGEWLGFVDSDDWILPEMYEKMIAAAVREQTDLAVCQILNCYADGRTEVDCFWQTERPMTAAGSASDKVFRRSLIEDLRFPEGLWYEDFAFSALALSRAGRFAGVRRRFASCAFKEPERIWTCWRYWTCCGSRCWMRAGKRTTLPWCSTTPCWIPSTGSGSKTAPIRKP